jgi:hypothetical protein
MPLRIPAMARGFQVTDLMSTPPKLHNKAALKRNKVPRCFGIMASIITEEGNAPEGDCGNIW